MRLAMLQGHAAAAAVLAALVAALFFNGVSLPWYAASGALLVAALVLVLLRGAREGVAVPVDAVSGSLALFWAWLGASAMLSPAPGVSTISFWWLGALPLAFWAVRLDRESVWPVLLSGAALIALALAVYAVVQALWLQQAPSASFINRNSLAAFLNLLALPLLAFSLPSRSADAHARVRPLLGGSAFVLLTTVALIGSRGALLGLLAGAALLILVNLRVLRRGDYVYLLGLIGGALVLANLLTHGYLSDRSLSLADPVSAGASRWLIWERAWALLEDAPWYGIGIGVFWLAFPPYRHPEDTSAGFYVHNDYLQIWIESGWPGLALLLVLIAALAGRLLSFLRGAPQTSARLEAAALFAGLLAVGVHSLFTFNLYLMQTLIVAGVLLARFHRLTRPQPRVVVLHPAARFSPRFVQWVLVLAALFPLSHFGSHLGTELLRQQAARALQAGELADAHRMLIQAQRLSPSLDTTWYAHADVLRNTMAALDDRETERRRVLFELALDNLAHAEAVNPLRPQVPYIRGMLYTDASELAGAQWEHAAEKAFRRALALDPRFLPARLASARLRLARGDEAGGLAVLRQGLHYRYAPDSVLAEYLDRTRVLLAQFGEKETARALAERYVHVFGVAPPDPTSVPSATARGSHTGGRR